MLISQIVSKDLSPPARLASPLVTASSSLEWISCEDEDPSLPLPLMVYRHHFNERPPPSPPIQWRRAQDMSATHLELQVHTFSISFYFSLLLISTIIYRILPLWPQKQQQKSRRRRRRRREWDEGIGLKTCLLVLESPVRSGFGLFFSRTVTGPVLEIFWTKKNRTEPIKTGHDWSRPVLEQNVKNGFKPA